MAKVKFGDVVRETKEKVDRSNNPYKFYVAGDHMDTEDLSIRRKGCFATDDVGPAFIRVFHEGQVLYGSRRTYLKKIAVADFDGVTANTTFVLETKDENVLRQRLIPFIMYTEKFTEWSVKKSKGSTNPYVLFCDLADYEFDLPSVEKQDELAELLWGMVEAKEAYQELLRQTDEVVKAQFIEMFGDPTSNPNGWTKLTVRDAVKRGYIARPLDGNHGAKHPKGDDYVPEGVPFIMAQDLKDKQVDFNSCHFITERQASTLKKGWAKTGDVLLTNKGTIGRVAIVQESAYENMLLTPQITYYRCLNGIDNEYLAGYFITDFFVNQLEKLTTGTTRASVTITQQENLELIIPPVDMQKEFVVFVKHSDKSKIELEQAIKSLEAIYNKIISENLG